MHMNKHTHTRIHKERERRYTQTKGTYASELPLAPPLSLSLPLLLSAASASRASCRNFWNTFLLAAPFTCHRTTVTHSR